MLMGRCSMTWQLQKEQSSAVWGSVTGRSGVSRLFGQGSRVVGVGQREQEHTKGHHHHMHLQNIGLVPGKTQSDLLPIDCLEFPHSRAWPVSQYNKHCSCLFSFQSMACAFVYVCVHSLWLLFCLHPWPVIGVLLDCGQVFPLKTKINLSIYTLLFLCPVMKSYTILLVNCRSLFLGSAFSGSDPRLWFLYSECGLLSMIIWGGAIALTLGLRSWILLSLIIRYGMI